MVTLATGPRGPSRSSLLGASLGAGLSRGFVPAFQQRTEELEFQKQFNPIREALQGQLAGGASSPGQQLIQQITQDPNIFSQVMQKPELAQTILSLNQAAAPPDTSLTGFSKIDETNATFKAAVEAEGLGEFRRAKALFKMIGLEDGPKGSDLVHLVRAGTDLTIPTLLGKDDKLRSFSGEEVTLQEGDRLLESLTVSGAIEGVLGPNEVNNLRTAQISTENFIATAGDALRLIQEEPGAITLTGRAAALFGDLKAEAKTFAQIFGMKFDENQLNPDTYNAIFVDELGITNARMQSMITSLAFQAAAAAGQRNQSVSNRDIERFIRQVGGNARNPAAFVAVLRDEAERTARNFRTNFRVRTQKEFEGGDLGLSELPGGGVGVSTDTLTAEEIDNMTTEEMLRQFGL